MGELKEILKDKKLINTIAQCGNTENGKKRVLDYYKQNGMKGFSDMLKKEYGEGGWSGHSELYPVQFRAKGVDISTTNIYGEWNIHLTWNEVAKLTEYAIKENLL